MSSTFTPCISRQIMNDIAAADGQKTFFPQRCEPFPQFIMEYGRLRLIDAELHDRDICARKYLTGFTKLGTKPSFIDWLETISCFGCADKGAVVDVGKGLLQFLLRIHHDGSAPGDGLPQRPAGEKHKAYACLLYTSDA